MVYYLRSVYEDGRTRLGTWGNDVFKGVSLKRKLTNFKKLYQNKKAMDGKKIIGVEIEHCERTFSRPISTERVIW
jgi:hypothetical protein